MTLLKTTRTPYLFDKAIAAHVVHAELKHFAADASAHGPTEEELQSLTRRLSWITDKDLNWCEIDQLVSLARELRTVEAGTHPMLTVNRAGTVDDTDHVRASVLLSLFWETSLVLGTVRARWENLA